jgi:hypothetical protein
MNIEFQAEGVDVADIIPGKLLVLVVGGRTRRDAFGGKPAHAVEQLLLVLGQREGRVQSFQYVHACPRMLQSEMECPPSM